MKRSIWVTACGTAAAIVAATAIGLAQRGAALAPDAAARRWEIEKELQSIAVVERKVMMPMRDGVRLATDIYRPKDASTKVPTIWVRTPYNFNYWDVRNGVPRDLTAALTAVKRGYAYVVQNERGHFFSEGNYDILGSPTDGYDALDVAVEAAVVERQGRDDRVFVDRRVSDGRRGARAPRVCGDERAGFRRRRRPGRAVFRAGQLVSRRRRSDAVHYLDLRPAESGAADVSARHVAGGFDPRLEGVRSGAAAAASGLVQGAVAPARSRTS